MTGSRAHGSRQEPPANDAVAPSHTADHTESGGVSLSDSVRWVQRETGGRILGVEHVPYEGHDINRVKYMDARGRVRYMDDTESVQQVHEVHAEPRQAEMPQGDDNAKQ